MKRILGHLHHYASRWWYPPLLAISAALDIFVVIIPTDGLVISSSALVPKRWFPIAVSVALGSTMGAVLLAALVEIHGLPFILHWYPGVDQTTLWVQCEHFFNQYGLWVAFAIAATPLTQQPVIILGALANTPLEKLAWALLAGRMLKYLLMSYLGSHAPHLLRKIWPF